MLRNKLYIILFATVIASCSREIVAPVIKPSNIQEDEAKYNYYYSEALRNKLVGSPANALALFEECIKIDPSRDGAYYQIAQISLVTGNLANAVKYGRLATQRSNNQWYYNLLGNAYYQAGKMDSAVIVFKKAVELFPESEELKFSLGNLYFESGNFTGAADIFKYFDNKYGIGGNSAVPLIKSLIALGEYNEAESRLRVLIETYPEEKSFMGLLAELYSVSGESDKAQKLYEKLISEDPDDMTTLYSITDFFRKENSYNELFNLFNTIALKEGISEEEKVSYFALQLEDEQIVTNYSREFELSLLVLEASNEESSVARLLRPELYIKAGRKREAAALLEGYLQRWPEVYYAWEKLLIIYADEKMYGELYASSTNAIRRFNTAVLPRLLNAVASLEEGLYDETLEQLVRVKRIINSDVTLTMQVLSLEADALYRKGDTEAAFSKYDEALSIDPNNNLILNNYAYFLAEKGVRLNDALKMSEKVISSEGDNNTYIDTYAWALYKKGKYKKAENVMRMIIDSEDNSDSEYYEHFGYILKARGKCEEAVISWKKALDLDSSKTGLEEEIGKCLMRRR